MLFEGFSDHLCREPRLHIPKPLDRLIAILDLSLVLVPQRLFVALLLEFSPVKTVLQLVALLLDGTDCGGDCQLLFNLASVELRHQLLDL